MPPPESACFASDSPDLFLLPSGSTCFAVMLDESTALIERRLGLAIVRPKSMIHSPWPTRNSIHSIHGLSTSVFGRPFGLVGSAQPFSRRVAGDVERADLLSPMKGDTCILGQRLSLWSGRLRLCRASREIAEISSTGRRPTCTSYALRALDPKQTIDTRTSAPSTIHSSSSQASKMAPFSLMCSSTHRFPPPRMEFVANKADAGHLRPLHRSVRSFATSSVTRSASAVLVRHSAAKRRSRSLSPSSSNHQLTAQERRIADDHICRRPLRLGAVRVQYRVAAFDGVERPRIGFGRCRSRSRIHWISPIQTETRASSAA